MLLVGGDSFAQFPKTEWVLERKQNRPCPEWDGKNFHWCELLAEQLNIASESVGIQGGDSATTSYETIRQLHLNENITHCIFFITMPWRVAIREKPSTHERAYKKRMMHYAHRLRPRCHPGVGLSRLLEVQTHRGLAVLDSEN